MINGVVLQKLQTLDRVLTELRSLGQVTAAQLESDWRIWRAVERTLQILVEVVIFDRFRDEVLRYVQR